MSISSPENIGQHNAERNVSVKADLFFDIDGNPDLGENVSKSIAVEGHFGGIVQSEVIGTAPECRLKISASFKESGILVDLIRKVTEIILACKEAMKRETEKYRQAITDSFAPKGPVPA